MSIQKTLTQEEEERCFRFLKVLGITRAEDRFLSDRGYFSLYLTGLRPEEVGADVHPDSREFREMIRLLSLAGVEQIRDVLRRRSTGEVAQLTPLPVSGIGADGQLRPVVARPGGRPHYQKDIGVIRPTDSEIQHLREIPKVDLEEEAIVLSEQHSSEGLFQDAYHVLFDYLMLHPLTQKALLAANAVIMRASAFDRRQNLPPYNMLYECEEMAALLVKRVPNLAKLRESGDAQTNELYHFVKLVYRTWTAHSHALLEYKYRVNEKDWMIRNWIDPREFGFIVEIMRMGIRSQLPLDLLRYIYTEIKGCIDIGKKVIAHEDKRCQFFGDCLRIVASPAKDVIPDLQFEIYREIIYTYLKQGDTANALTFTKQALLIHKYDKEMNRLKQEIEDKGAQKTRR
jgi:hypothetical protein